MSKFLEAFDERCAAQPDTVAFFNSDGESLTYAQLNQYSGALAAYLLETVAPKKPVVCYGHKSMWMPVCMLACVRSGRAYVPADVSFPPARIKDMLEQIGDTTLLDTTQKGLALTDAPAHTVVRRGDIERIATAPNAKQVTKESYVSGRDDFYIIFTSGSTGRPKGVQFASDGVDVFQDTVLDTFMPSLVQDPHVVIFDRVPFSFDVSVTDFTTGLMMGSTLYAITETAERDLKSTLAALAKSNAQIWHSTPSFANMCLTSPDFNQDLMPQMRRFVFGGESLQNGMVRKLQDRFPLAEVVNGYGPTETQYVTATVITREQAESQDLLPIGVTSPGTEIHIIDPETLQEVPTGQPGEIYIYGGSVSNGYLGRPDLTEKAFSDATLSDGTPTRRYKTGDNGYIDENGVVYFYGRYDFQVKLHGYRIELGEIETRLCDLPQVVNAVVIPVFRNDEMDYLCACVMLMPGVPKEYATTRMLKDALKENLPEYMVPRKFVYLDEYPLNPNGKVDRKALKAIYGVVKSAQAASAGQAGAQKADK